jgi:glycine oxidase
MAAPDVVIVGAGAIGLASAWRLVQRGVTVEVVDPHPGGGASTVAAGMLAPITEARLGEEVQLRLGLASWERWPDLAAELGGAAIGYRSDGTVMVALEADDRAALVDMVDRYGALGLDVEVLKPRELRALEPGLAPGFRRGARVAAERSVEPAALLDVLLAAAEQAGAVIRRDRVTSVLTVPGGGRALGVELADGDQVAAGTVVLAAGAWSSQIGGLDAAVRPLVRPVKGQILTLRQRPDDLVVQHMVRSFVRGSVVYLVPRNDGRLVCGAPVEEQGWDATRTAGGGHQLLRDALATFPGLDDAELVDVKVGFRPATPDDLPLIGPSGIDGLLYATGHYRNGILLTPITAAAIAALVSGEVPPVEVAPCDPRRFTEPALRGMAAR